jgi:hypothetical protein
LLSPDFFEEIVVKSKTRVLKAVIASVVALSTQPDRRQPRRLVL